MRLYMAIYALSASVRMKPLGDNLFIPKALYIWQYIAIYAIIYMAIYDNIHPKICILAVWTCILDVWTFILVYEPRF